MYVNSDNEIVNIIKDKRAINKPNFVSKEELINLLMDKRYITKPITPYKITKFNINIELSKLEEFIEDNTDNDSKKSSTQFINNYDNLSEIQFENTIFNNLNYLFVILKERKAETKSISKTKQNKTKSVNYKIKPIHKKTRKYLNIIKE